MLLAAQTAMFLGAVRAGWHFHAATLLILATLIKLSMVPQMQANRVILALRRMEERLAARG